MPDRMLDQLLDQARAVIRRVGGAERRPPLHRDPSYRYAVQFGWGPRLIPVRAEAPRYRGPERR